MIPLGFAPEKNMHACTLVIIRKHITTVFNDNNIYNVNSVIVFMDLITYVIASGAVLFIVIFLVFFAKKIAKYIRIGLSRKSAQHGAVIARYRNAATKALWFDMTHYRLGPLDIELEDKLKAFAPTTMKKLEEQRTKDPEAWRETIIFLLPIAAALRAMTLNVNEGIADAAKNAIQQKPPEKQP